MATTRKAQAARRKRGGDTSAETRKRPAQTAARRERVDGLAANAARVFDLALSARQIKVTEFAERVHSTHQTIGNKRAGRNPLSIKDLEEFGAALGIPSYLFLMPVSELYNYLGAESRGEVTERGRDQGFRNSPYNPIVAAHDPEIRDRDAVLLAV